MPGVRKAGQASGGVRPGLLIRPARLVDADAIARVHVASWRAAYRGVVSGEFLDAMSVDDRIERWRERLEAADRPTLVLEHDGALAGFASLGPARDDDLDPRRVGEVYAIYLDPGSWGRGLGRELMGAGRALLTDLGFSLAILWVLKDNQRARRFYFKDGWRVDGAEKPISIGGRDLVEVRYRRPIQAT